MAEALKRPGGELASRPLHFFWVVDCSGSMYGEKIGTVNHAIQSTIPEMVDAAKDMRLEKTGHDRWLTTWAFPIKESSAKREGYEKDTSVPFPLCAKL